MTCETPNFLFWLMHISPPRVGVSPFLVTEVRAVDMAACQNIPITPMQPKIGIGLKKRYYAPSGLQWPKRAPCYLEEMKCAERIYGGLMS